MRDQGLVEAAEERRQACFHVMVSDRYTEWREANLLADKIAENEAKTFSCMLLLLSSLALAQHPVPHKKAAKATPVTRPKADPALAIHQSALIVDTHADTPQRLLDENFDLGQTRLSQKAISISTRSGRQPGSGVLLRLG